MNFNNARQIGALKELGKATKTQAKRGEQVSTIGALVGAGDPKSTAQAQPILERAINEQGGVQAASESEIVIV